MGFIAVRRQLLFLLITALSAVVAAFLARFLLDADTGKLVTLWVLSIAAPIILAQGLYLRATLSECAREVEASKAAAVSNSAASAVADSRETVNRLESRIQDLESEVVRKSAPPQPDDSSSAESGSMEPKKGSVGNQGMVDGLRSMMVDAGERVQALLSGGNRLEIGITLAPGELESAREMMAAIGRVINRPAMEEIAESTPSDGKVRLLLVDDDRTCRRIFKAMLPKDVSFLTVECDDGSAAMVALETPPFPDIIVCDIMMPNLDGFEFLKKVRDMPRVSHTPVIMATSNAFRENVSRAATLNVCRFLKKPLTRTDVETAIRFAMTQNERKRSSIIEAQERLCLDDRAYFELACGFSRAITETITFVRSAISRDRWQVAGLRVNAVHGSIQLVGDERLAAALGRVSAELNLWDVNRVTIELELLEQENERFARTLIQLFTETQQEEPSSLAVGVGDPSPGTAAPQVAADGAV
jgi:CheY-like chemotaxis protein